MPGEDKEKFETISRNKPSCGPNNIQNKNNGDEQRDTIMTSSITVITSRPKVV